MVYFGTITFIVLVLVVGVLAFRYYINGFDNNTDAQHFSKYYVMITDEPESSLWQLVYQGAYETGLENDAYVELLGDSLDEKYSKTELMDIAISSDVDGIMVYADDSDEMRDKIDTANRMGIPVVTLYSDCNLSKRCSFVGVGGYNIGREYGKQIIKLQKEKSTSELQKRTDIVVLTDTNQNDSRLTVMLSGIQETLENEIPNSDDYSISVAKVDNTNEFSAEESIRDLFNDEEVPDIFVCLNELNTTCVYQAAVDYNMVGDVNILGYYDSETILNAIDHNVIRATVSIDTYQMGEFSVDALEEYNDLGYTNEYFTANVAIIDSNNVGEYLTKEEDDAEN